MTAPYKLILLLLLTAVPLTPTLAEISAIIVVRHAEDTEGPQADPELTSSGRVRAKALADGLAHANVVGLIASQYRRTRQTLAPLSHRRDLEIRVIPAVPGRIDRHITALAKAVHLWEDDGVLVIAGHSNTVPRIVKALSGQPVEPIDETEYDRLFILVPDESGMNVVTARYGDRSQSSAK